MDHFPIILFLFWLVENLGLNTFVVSWAVWMCPLTLAWQPSLWINSSVPFWHSERFKNDPKWPPSVRQHVEGTERYKFNEFWPHGTEKGWILAFYCTITAMIKITIVVTVKMTTLHHGRRTISEDSYSFDDLTVKPFHPFTEGELNSDQSAIPQHWPSVCSWSSIDVIVSSNE